MGIVFEKLEKILKLSEKELKIVIDSISDYK
jgi:hypothetical protein